jgi:hypothetical protein
MVKTAKKAPKKSSIERLKHPGRTGRPRVDPNDLRTARIAFRIHPDLAEELGKVARLYGEVRTAFLEKLAIAAINDAYERETGHPRLDPIGRYIDQDPVDDDGIPESHRSYVPKRPQVADPLETYRRRTGIPRLTLDDVHKLPPPPKRR